MDARILPTSCKLFSFTHFRKNASATPLVSHTFKTKDLKPFRFTHFQKKVGGDAPFASPDSIGKGAVRVSLSNIQHLTTNPRSSLTDHPTRMVVPSERSEPRDLRPDVTALSSTLTNFAPATPLAPTLTGKLHFKPFRINTYKKGGEGEGGGTATPGCALPSSTSCASSISCPS